MNGERILMVLAPDPVAAQQAVINEDWDKGTRAIWAGIPREVLVLGAPEGLRLFEVTAMFVFAPPRRVYETKATFGLRPGEFET